MLFPLAIPPGQWGNGTMYQAKSRWARSQLVRWLDGTLRPMGGWTTFSLSTLTGKARALLTWSDNSGLPWIAVGTHLKLYAVSGTGNVTDISPVGMSEGYADATTGGGYGTSTYGTGDYGTARPPDGSLTAASVWTLDTFGEDLIACNGDDGKIWSWAPDTSAVAALLSANAPTGVSGIVTTSEGFLMALGVEGDPRQVAWCDQFDTSTWTNDGTNQAGAYSIATSGKLVAGVKVTGATLIFTDTDLHRAEYLGAPFLFGFDQIGTACGLVGRGAYAPVSTNLVYWMTDGGFRVYNGEVQELSCDVADLVFRDFNTVQKSKVTAYHDSAFGEVTWFYASAGSDENDSYVRYNIKEGHWAKGEASDLLARLSAVERGGGFTLPFAMDDSGNVLALEDGFDYDTLTPYAETGPIELGTGEQVMNVMGIIPDEGTLGDVRRTIFSSFHPTDVETTNGPYASAQPIDTRFQGRQIRMKVEFIGGGDDRYGSDRLDLSAGGSRR